MTVTTHTPTRKTTDVTINGECWHPIAGWIRQCHRVDDPHLLTGPDALTGLAQLLKKTRSLTARDDVTLRLPHRNMEALGQQMRFWEACIDELKPQYRTIAPNPGYFQEFALNVESAIQETYRPPQPWNTPPPICFVCKQPVPGTGHAAVDLDPALGVTALFRHAHCSQTPA